MSKKQTIKKALTVVTSLAVVIAISICSAVIIHDKRSKNAVTTSVENGLSAYELAVQYGYKGTVQEWLNSLNGKSAYEIAQDNGYSGSESDWANTLKATAGKDGVGIKTATFNADGQLVITLSDNTAINLGNAVGANGKDGVNGTNGTNGQDGNGITKTEINANGELVITYSNGTTENLGVVVGKNGINGTNGQDGAKGDKGDQGIQGEKGEKGDKGDTGADGKDGNTPYINANGNWQIGDTDTGIKAEGKDGANGTDGQNGQDGIGIDSVKIENGILLIKYTNTTDYTTIGNIKGDDGVGIAEVYVTDGYIYVRKTNETTATPLAYIIGKDGTNGTKGKEGEKGEKGYKGDNGKDGRGIKKTEISGNNLIIYYTDGTSDTHDLSGISQGDGTVSYLTYTLLDDDTYSVALDTTYLSSITSVNIPTTYNGKPVTAIAENAFHFYNSTDSKHISATRLTSVTIPESVTTIGEYAFYSCRGLTKITIPNSVTTIASRAFSSCTGLTEITIPNSVTTIGSEAFEYCTVLTKVNITDISAWCNIDFKSSDSNPLYYINNLYLNGELVTKLVIPDNVTKIKKYAFYNCTSLTEITISENVTLIDELAFAKTSITKAYFSETDGWKRKQLYSSTTLNTTVVENPTQMASYLKSTDYTTTANYNNSKTYHYYYYYERE